MKTARVVGSALLAMTLVFGLVMAFMPLGEAWVGAEGARKTETYGMFTKVVEDETSSLGAQTWFYIDQGLEGTGGITYLSLMGPVFATGLILVFIAFLLTAIPSTGESRAGGWIALPGSFLILVAIAFFVLGTRLHAFDQVSVASHVVFPPIAIAVGLITVALAFIATGMGFVRGRDVVAEESGWLSDVETNAHGWVAGRNLRCPDCSTVVTAGYGVVPICPTCEFGADYEGPAGAPVPSRAVYGPGETYTPDAETA